MSKNITAEELENLVMEELDGLDEGLWDTIKGYASGVGGALTSPLGKVGQGYQRGKASSALKTTAQRLENVRKEFIEDIEDLFQPIGGGEIALPPELEDVQKAWNSALSDVERAAETFERLSQEIKSTVTRDRRKASWDRGGGSPTPTPAPAQE